MLAPYGAVADMARVADPNRKRTIESAVQHTQSTALKGRKFESIEAQNTWLAHWEERWAAPRIHGRKKRQVLQMYLEDIYSVAASLAGICGMSVPCGTTKMGLPNCIPHPA